ncbi:PIG-L family deacetylase [Mycobacterium sp. OAE908]|uniref:PIG-L family deacetylase n=1 Tax=Mycobacterium sp. OAE908 TaxID=2817899 RepID=UPI001AE7E461
MLKDARSFRPRRGCATVVTLIVFCAACVSQLSPSRPSVQLYIVAHEDDTLLFQSPSLLHDMQSRDSVVTTVYVTAGDDGQEQAYWTGREAAVNSAYAYMAGVPDKWIEGVTNAAGHDIVTYTLSGAPDVRQLFIRLPDGNLDGSGFHRYGEESLQKLWTTQISTMHPVDGSQPYTSQDLTATLTALMAAIQPDIVRVQDYIGTFGDRDHSDHHASAYYARAAHQKYTRQHEFLGYQDYPTQDLPANVSGADLVAKRYAFYAYAQHDSAVCGSTAACAGSEYESWLRREYLVQSEANRPGNPGGS